MNNIVSIKINNLISHFFILILTYVVKYCSFCCFCPSFLPDYGRQSERNENVLEYSTLLHI